MLFLIKDDHYKAVHFNHTFAGYCVMDNLIIPTALIYHKLLPVPMDEVTPYQTNILRILVSLVNSKLVH